MRAAPPQARGRASNYIPVGILHTAQTPYPKPRAVSSPRPLRAFVPGIVPHPAPSPGVWGLNPRLEGVKVSRGQRGAVVLPMPFGPAGGETNICLSRIVSVCETEETNPQT